MPDWTALTRLQQVAVIGFFGQARERVDHSAILELEHDIVTRAGAFPGMLAYHNARLAEGGWGNMVVFASRAETAGLTADPSHIRAVQRTPGHYDSLRLHRGTLADGLLGDAEVVLGETLYLDFSADRPPVDQIGGGSRPQVRHDGRPLLAAEDHRLPRGAVADAVGVAARHRRQARVATQANTSRRLMSSQRSTSGASVRQSAAKRAVARGASAAASAGRDAPRSAPRPVAASTSARSMPSPTPTKDSSPTATAWAAQRIGSS